MFQRESFHQFLIARRAVTEALARTGAGQSAENEDSDTKRVNVMPSAADRAERTGGRTERGRLMERRCRVSFAAHHTLNSEVEISYIVYSAGRMPPRNTHDFQSAYI